MKIEKVFGIMMFLIAIFGIWNVYTYVTGQVELNYYVMGIFAKYIVIPAGFISVIGLALYFGIKFIKTGSRNG